jgi:hypothetical protein
MNISQSEMGIGFLVDSRRLGVGLQIVEVKDSVRFGI